MDNFEGIQAIIIKETDNVATAIVSLKKGDVFKGKLRVKDIQVEIDGDIKSGHKFAICFIKKGEHIIKYGEVIGIAKSDIKCGEHVHIQNVDSLRGRGDIAPESV